MNSNEKEKIILNVLRKRIPFINDIRIRRTFVYQEETSVIVECDMDKIQEMYPDNKIDWEYLDDVAFGDSVITLFTPYEVFSTMPEGGDQIRELILSMYQTVGMNPTQVRFEFDI
jgi:hypothetical protein